jgi:hypothetical protein
LEKLPELYFCPPYLSSNAPLDEERRREEGIILWPSPLAFAASHRDIPSVLLLSA